MYIFQEVEMNHLNSILLEGVLVKDPRVVAVADNGNRRLVKFDLANDRYYMDSSGAKKVETLFIPVQVWGELANMCMEKMKSGMTCRAVGRLRMCNWVNKEGDKRSSIEILASHLEYRRPWSAQDPHGGVEILEDKEKEADKLGESVVLYEF